MCNINEIIIKKSLFGFNNICYNNKEIGLIYSYFKPTRKLNAAFFLQSELLDVNIDNLCFYADIIIKLDILHTITFGLIKDQYIYHIFMKKVEKIILKNVITPQYALISIEDLLISLNGKIPFYSKIYIKLNHIIFKLKIHSHKIPVQYTITTKDSSYTKYAYFKKLETIIK